MLAKVVLVLIYLLLVFVAAKVLDISSSWLELSCVASPLFNPFALSVKKLKSLLDERGVSYAGVVDKRELAQLVKESGSFNSEENCPNLENDRQESEGDGEITHFTSSSHLYEDVEDTKASGWLVLVIPHYKRPLLRQKQWQQLSKKVSRFGIRTGVFDCNLDPFLCSRNGWEEKCLILSSPQSNKPKGHVMINVYNSKPSVERVFSWMNSILAKKVKKLHTHREYLHFLHEDKRFGQTKVVLFGRLDDPPALLSSLSIKFTGRVKFGYFKITEHNIHEVQEKAGIQTKILVVTPEKEFYYGLRKGEVLHYKAMELFLTNIHPEVNDLFLLAIILVNQACFLELFLTPGGVLRKSVKFFLLIGVANTAVIIGWLPLMGVFKLAFIQPVLNIGLKISRFIMGSDLASLVRYNFLTYSQSPMWFLMGFCVYGLCVNKLKKRFKCCMWSDEEDEETPDWFYQDIAYFQRFFSSFRTIGSPSPNMRGFEERFDVLIQRLAIPDLWLHPLLPTDFVKDLPLWKNCDCEPLMQNQSAKVGKLEEKALQICDPNVCQNCNKPVNIILGKECVICLELYIKDCIMVALPCLHVFHQHCLEKWFNSGNHCRNLNCPVCRWPAYKPRSQIHDISQSEILQNS